MRTTKARPGTIPELRLGTTLRRLRLRKGLFQRELADIVGMASNDVAKYERDLYQPSIARAVQLADALGVSMDELCGRAAPVAA